VARLAPALPFGLAAAAVVVGPGSGAGLALVGRLVASLVLVVAAAAWAAAGRPTPLLGAACGAAALVAAVAA
jgi:hypothetical protein